MAYEPTLIIDFESLIDKEPEIKELKDDFPESKYLWKLIREGSGVDFKGIQIVVCCPGGSSFNRSVREEMDDLDIYYTSFDG